MTVRDFKKGTRYRNRRIGEISCPVCMFCTLFNYRTYRYSCRYQAMKGTSDKWMVVGEGKSCDLSRRLTSENLTKFQEETNEVKYM